jgi:RNA polymerase sigma factor (sigma-70 family)
MDVVNPCFQFQHFTDERLLDAMLNDDAAHSCIYLRHKSYCINFMMSKGASENDAIDIYQDATIVLYQKIRSRDFKLNSSIQTYLNSVCYNQLRARGKSSYNKKTVLTEDIDENVHDWFEEVNEESQIKINKIVNALGNLKVKGDKCYERLRLFYYDNLTMAEISVKLGFTNADSAKAQVDKCRSLLKKILGV